MFGSLIMFSGKPLLRVLDGFLFVPRQIRNTLLDRHGLLLLLVLVLDIFKPLRG